MGYKEFTSALSNANDADFRDWVGKWLQGWDDAGWVRASDTGQIDPETVTAPTAATWQGFAMYRFDDELQATHPVFIKMEFGGTGSSGLNPQARLTIGKDTDGAGEVSQTLYTAVLGTATGSSGGGTTAALTHLASASESHVAFLAFVDDSSTGQASTVRAASFVVERSRGVGGEATEHGLLVISDKAPSNVNNSRSLTSISGTTAKVSAINYTSGQANESALIGGAPYSIQGTTLGPTTSLAAGGVGPVIPVVAIAPGAAPWQSCAFVTIPSGDAPAGIFTVPLCGAPVAMRAIPPSYLHSVWGLAMQPWSASSPGVSRYFSPAIRWEE